MASILVACNGSEPSANDDARLDAQVTIVPKTPVDETVARYASDLCGVMQTLADDARDWPRIEAEIAATVGDEDHALQVIVQHFRDVVVALHRQAGEIRPPAELVEFHSWYVAQAEYVIQVEERLLEAQRSGVPPTPPPTVVLPDLDEEVVEPVFTALTKNCDAYRELVDR